MKLSYWLPLLALGSFLVSSCANMSSPSGGPKDTIPPTLVESNPAMGAVNVSSKSIRLEFSEYIQQRNLQQQLIVSPLTSDFRYKTKLNKEILELEFEKPLEPNTTYTFNFGNSIGDITENNPAENLTIAFSTGSTIDSIGLTGTVMYLKSGKPADKAVVGLYPEADTATILTRKPYYVTRTNEQGQYRFQYLKPGTYQLYAGQDANQNMKIESRSEAYGFRAAPIDLNSSKDSVLLQLVSINADSLKLNSARVAGRYYEVTYNKPLLNYSLYPQENQEKPANNLVNENKTIRFYPKELGLDSLGMRIAAKDSLDMVVIDTVFIKFAASDRAPEPFGVSITPTDGSTVDNTFAAELTFTKPVAAIRPEGFYIAYDSLHKQPIDIPETAWNENHTKLSLDLQLNKPTYPDSIPVQQRPRNFTLTIEEKTVISIENDTLAQQAMSYGWLNVSETGSISGRINTDISRNLIIELLKPNEPKPIRKTYGKADFNFQRLPAGDYTMRITRDTNNNYRWDAGNIYEKREPEAIYIVPTPITIKANWEVKDVEISLPNGV